MPGNGSQLNVGKAGSIKYSVMIDLYLAVAVKSLAESLTETSRRTPASVCTLHTYYLYLPTYRYPIRELAEVTYTCIQIGEAKGGETF